MVQFHCQGKFLGEHCGVLRVIGVLGLETLQHMPLAVTLRAEQAGVAAGRKFLVASEAVGHVHGLRCNRPGSRYIVEFVQFY